MSPFIGVEGLTSWAKTKGGSYVGVPMLPQEGSGTKWEEFGSDEWHRGFDVFANIGIAGKWLLGNNFLFNTQVKYSIVFYDMDSNHFVFTAGIGYIFNPPCSP